MSNQPLTTTQRLAIAPCKFMMLQAKLHQMFANDKKQTRAIIKQLLDR